jgi:hypothetical protein
LGETPTTDPAEFRPGLSIVRRRRWYLWMVILVYVPAMWLTLKVSPTYHSVEIVFAVWFVVLFAVATYSALVRCPRCGNYFHMHGMTLLFLRKCLHCQLHVCADKRADKR